MKDGWEYTTLSVNVSNGHVHDAAIDEKLNQLGNEGWELTHVTPLALESKTACVVHYFRRVAERPRSAGFQP
jgi:hypothetical protein